MARAASGDNLLDEIAVGCEANVAKIQHGHARYTVGNTAYKNGKEQPRTEENYQVWFDFPKVRTDLAKRQSRRIYFEDYSVQFKAENLRSFENLERRIFLRLSIPKGRVNRFC